MRVRLRDIEVGGLNNVCIMLISKFARVLREHNGQVLRLRDKHVVQKVARCAAIENNSELKAIYMRLKVEIKNHLNKENIRHSDINNTIKTRSSHSITQRRAGYQASIKSV